MIIKKKKILITDHLFKKDNFYKYKILKKKYNIIFNKSKKPYNNKALINLLNKNKDVEGIIAGLENYNKETLKTVDNLKVISRVGVGLDSLDLGLLKNKKIAVFKLNNELTESVAELYVTLILNLLRKIIPNYENLKKGKWSPIVGNNIISKKIGIVGYGKIGKKIHELLSNFGCSFYVYEKKNIKNKKLRKISLKNIFNKCDILCISLSLNKSTKKLINKRIFNNAKKDIILINASRGGVINENELFSFFKKNKKATAFLDCFTNEPYKGNLIKLKNIFSIPHIASYTVETRKRMEISSSKNLIKYLEKIEK